MSAVKKENQFNSLILRKIELMNEDETGVLDITKMFTQLNIVESMDEVFYYGEILFNDEHNMVETLPLNGKQKIRISWKSHKDIEQRNHVFRILSIPEIGRIRENVLDQIKLTFGDERYYKLINGRYNKSYISSTPDQVITDIFKNKNITNYTLSGTTETFDFYNMENSCLSFINKMRFRPTIPHILYQKDNVIRFESWYDIWKQEFVKPLNTYVINADKTTQNNLTISELVKKDLFDVPEIQFMGLNGYELFESDLYNKSFSLQTKTLDTYFNKFKDGINKKFDYSSNTNNIRRTENSAYIENYIKTNFITASMAYGDSSLFVGDKVSIKLLRDIQKKEFSKYSGTWIIYELEHSIDSDMNYTQNLVLVKNSFFRNN